VIALHVLWMAFVILYITWMLYCAIMSLKKAKDENRLTTAMKVLGYPLLFIGYLFDIVANIIVSVFMLHVPKELLLTAKLKRIQLEAPNGWRNKTAMWICVNLLNPLDPTGHHC
jgi:hypothetical protein